MSWHRERSLVWYPTVISIILPPGDLFAPIISLKDDFGQRSKAKIIDEIIDDL